MSDDPEVHLVCPACDWTVIDSGPDLCVHCGTWMQEDKR